MVGVSEFVRSKQRPGTLVDIFGLSHWFRAGVLLRRLVEMDRSRETNDVGPSETTARSSSPTSTPGTAVLFVEAYRSVRRALFPDHEERDVIDEAVGGECPNFRICRSPGRESRESTAGTQDGTCSWKVPVETVVRHGLFDLAIV
jgi:hypothetical protein